VTNTGDDKDTSLIDFQITQACPPLITKTWLNQHIVSPQIETFVTIIPILSVKGLDSIKLLGADLPIEELQRELSCPNPRIRGMELAKESMNDCINIEGVSGFYLYSYDTPALVELASFARTLRDA
jgi:hypothetical protein